MLLIVLSMLLIGRTIALWRSRPRDKGNTRHYFRWRFNWGVNATGAVAAMLTHVPGVREAAAHYVPALHVVQFVCCSSFLFLDVMQEAGGEAVQQSPDPVQDASDSMSDAA